MVGGNSIKLFSFNQKYFHVIGIYPDQWDQHGPTINSRNWIFIIFFLLFFLPTAAFFLFDAKSMLEYGLSFYAASVAFFMMWIYIAMIRQMKNTLTFIENCERFIAKRENSITKYQQLIAKIERLCEFIGITLIITLLILTLPFLAYSLINYFILDLREDSFLFVFQVKWPFNWKTPLGFLVAWFIQTGGLTVAIFLVIIFLNSIFGSCWLFIVMAEDITEDLVDFIKKLKLKKDRAEWRNGFCAIVKLHSDAKQCVSDFNGTVKYSLFSMIFFLMLSVSSVLVTLQFQLMDEDSKIVENVVVALIVIDISGILSFLCELGERISQQFDKFHQELERCDWHKLPFEMQKIYLMFLSDTQQSKNINCYGNVSLTRDTFKKISNNGFSYFMTLRRFDTVVN